MSESCKTCGFWRDLNDSWAHRGLCRRYPPKIGAQSRERELEHLVTIASDWCGEYQALGIQP